MFGGTARVLLISRVLFEEKSLPEACRRLACYRNTGKAWITAYQASGEWWPDPVIQNRRADNVLFAAVFLTEVNEMVQCDPEQFIGEMLDSFDVLFGLPGCRDDYKCWIATLDRILRTTGSLYKSLYRTRRKRDQVRRSAFARASLEIPFCCLISGNKTRKKGGDLRRRRGRWLRILRNDCLSQNKNSMERTSTMMAVGNRDCAIHSVTTPPPPAYVANDWLIF